MINTICTEQTDRDYCVIGWVPRSLEDLVHHFLCMFFMRPLNLLRDLGDVTYGSDIVTIGEDGMGVQYQFHAK